MFAKKDWKKNLLRVKQIADQNLGRAEKSEVLTEELQNLEKRVDLIKRVCQDTHKKLALCIQGQGPDVEKRLKKLPEAGLSHSLIESASLLSADTLLGAIFQLCGEMSGSLAKEQLQFEMDLDQKVLTPIHNLLENEIPSIQKLRKQLAKLTLDMDSARSRYNSAVRQTHAGGNAGANKLDGIKDELEEACNRVDQCKDHLSTEMYTFISRESEFTGLLLEVVAAQTRYHRRALDILDALQPHVEEQIEQSVRVPVFGYPLEDHLRRTNRDIAMVIEDCVCTLFEIGIQEEGLFRVAGSASKVKKLKAAFDSDNVDMEEYVRDVHCISGALKQYLRELPEPLMTFELYQEWMKAMHQPQDQRLQALWTVLDKLPKINYNNLRYLIKFLAKLAEYQDVNKMSTSNIAIVMGPNLLWPQGDGGPSVLSTSTQSAIVELLISNADYFFPGDLDFHKTAKGMTSPYEERRRSFPPAPVTNNFAHKGTPKSTHALNAGMGIVHQTLVTPASRSPSQNHERSPGVDKSLAEKSRRSLSSERTSTLVKGQSPGRAVDREDSISECSVGTASASSSRRASRESLRRSWRERPLVLGDSASASLIEGQEDKLSSNGDASSITETLSEPGTLNRSTLRRDIQLHRATTPPPKPPPPRGMHSDVYNTVFALQELGDGWSDYLTRVRTLWDGHMGQRPAGCVSPGGEAAAAEPVAGAGGGATAEVDFNLTAGSTGSGGSPAISVTSNSTSSLASGAAPQGDLLASAFLPTVLAAAPMQVGTSMSTPQSTPLSGASPTSSQNSLNVQSTDGSAGSASPKAPRRAMKKPAPLPPSQSERPPLPALQTFEKYSDKPAVPDKPSPPVSNPEHPRLYPQLTVSPPAGVHPDERPPPIPERPSVVPPSVPERPSSTDKPSSPHPDRPARPPPDRPSGPPPDKPSKPEKPDKPDKSAPGGGLQPSRPEPPATFQRSSSGRPPRPQPPPPPPPEQRKSSHDTRAPLAEPEDTANPTSPGADRDPAKVQSQDSESTSL